MSGYLRVELWVVGLELGVHFRQQLFGRFSRPLNRPDCWRVDRVEGHRRAPQVCVAVDVGYPVSGPLALFFEELAKRLVAVREVLGYLRQLEAFEEPALRRVLRDPSAP